MPLHLGFNYDASSANLQSQRAKQAQELARLQSDLAYQNFLKEQEYQRQQEDVKARETTAGYNTLQQTYGNDPNNTLGNLGGDKYPQYNFDLPGTGVLNRDALDTQKGNQLRAILGQQYGQQSGLGAGIPESFQAAQKAQQGIIGGNATQGLIPEQARSQMQSQIAKYISDQFTSAQNIGEISPKISDPNYYTKQAQLDQQLKQNLATKSGMFGLGPNETQFGFNPQGGISNIASGVGSTYEPIVGNRLGFIQKGINPKTGQPNLVPSMEPYLVGEKHGTTPASPMPRPSGEARDYIKSVNAPQANPDLLGPQGSYKDLINLRSSEPTIQSSDPALNDGYQERDIPGGPNQSYLATEHSSEAPTQFAPVPQGSKDYLKKTLQGAKDIFGGVRDLLNAPERELDIQKQQEQLNGQIRRKKLFEHIRQHPLTMPTLQY